MVCCSIWCLIFKRHIIRINASAFFIRILKRSTALPQNTLRGPLHGSKKDVEPYWVCLPMATRTALSSYEMYWYPWDNTKEDAWVRPMPQHEYVINIKNNPMTTYRYRMHQEDLAKQFGRWYRIAHGDKKNSMPAGDSR